MTVACFARRDSSCFAYQKSTLIIHSVVRSGDWTSFRAHLTSSTFSLSLPSLVSVSSFIHSVFSWNYASLGNTICVRVNFRSRGWVDDLSFFEYLSPFCFLSIEFHCTFSISYKILLHFVYYSCILIRM